MKIKALLKFLSAGQINKLLAESSKHLKVTQVQYEAVLVDQLPAYYELAYSIAYTDSFNTKYPESKLGVVKVKYSLGNLTAELY